MSNPRFAEYVTSGAFALTLSRNQVAALSLLAGAGSPGFGMNLATLERKGLAEIVRDPAEHDLERAEFRATYAGLLCVGLLREAGLTNGAPDSAAAELNVLRREVEDRRFEAVNARRDARSALARKQASDAELDAAQREIASLRLQLRSGLRLRNPSERREDFRPDIRLRDPIPERSDEQLSDAVSEPMEV